MHVLVMRNALYTNTVDNLEKYCMRETKKYYKLCAPNELDVEQDQVMHNALYTRSWRGFFPPWLFPTHSFVHCAHAAKLPLLVRRRGVCS